MTFTWFFLSLLAMYVFGFGVGLVVLFAPFMVAAFQMFFFYVLASVLMKR